ncbi:MAG: hypothetical protein JWQ55_1, partial [Rhodopila sp.]|nr:hypothetical protein [Rhodopila sp.]
TDHCPGGTCTHKVITPFGAHRIPQRVKQSPLGYEMTILPKVSAPERADFVLHTLAA